MEVFRSIHHPGDASPVGLFTQWLIRPLAVCMLPVMILMLVEVLQGRDVLRYVLYAFPAAIVLASAWTAFRMRAATAEIVVSGPYAEIRTVLDVLSRRPRNPWRMVLDVRKSDDHFQVAIGESVFEMPDEEWEGAPRVVQALLAARSAPLSDDYRPTSGQATEAERE